MSLDRDLLDAFLPEFAEAAARLGGAASAPAALRALDQLRAMAAALGAPSLTVLVEAALPPIDPFDAPALAAAAAALAAQAAAIGAAGAEVPLHPAAAPGPPVAGQPPASVRVLVVDDSAMMRRLVRETLETDPSFAVVAEAEEGAAALAALPGLKPDLVMLDIEMPVLDGLGVLREMALVGGPPVVVVSSAARPGSATALEARRLGATAIVAKPSGALSPDLRAAQGHALLAAARRAAGLPEPAP
jgi:CheY-like chemotaxis protein